VIFLSRDILFGVKTSKGPATNQCYHITAPLTEHEYSYCTCQCTFLIRSFKRQSTPSQIDVILHRIPKLPLKYGPAPQQALQLQLGPRPQLLLEAEVGLLPRLLPVQV
jgi:hypothetical protein